MSARPSDSPLVVVSLDDFCAVDEPGAEALVGDDASGAVIPQGGDIMVYGDGGAGKTTLCIDLAFHLAAGDDWLGISIRHPARVLIVENEGPRPLFRAKLRRKRDAWNGSPLGDRIVLVEDPWPGFTFADDAWRDRLASAISDHEIDVVIIGPVTRSGMNEAGTLQEVRDFMALVASVRDLSGRAVAFVLVHHENKGGRVSGAWEGAADTLFHVSGLGHGKTRLYVQKARWSSEHHATQLNLVWTDGEGFEVEDKPEITDEEIRDQILAAVGASPGTGWTPVEKAIKGVGNDHIRDVRDRLLVEGRIVNVIGDVLLDACPERQRAHLYLADDPTIAHLRHGSGAAPAQIQIPAPTTAATEASDACAVRRNIKRRTAVGADVPPSAERFDGGEE